MLALARFNVRIVKTGDAYGLNDCLINNDPPMVEFWDRRYMHTPRGQFVTRYNVSTLLARPPQGLALDYGVPAWTVNADDMKLVIAYLQGFADATDMTITEA